MTARTFRLNVVAAGGFNPGSPLLFDGFEYVVERDPVTLPGQTANGFVQNGPWGSVKATNINGAGSGRLYTVTSIPGYSGPMPGQGSRLLKMEALNISGGTDFYLQYGGAANAVPADVWFQFWIYINHYPTGPYGPELSGIENRHKFIYPADSYPGWPKWLVSLGSTPHNTMGNDYVPFGSPTANGEAFIVMRDMATTGQPNYAPAYPDNHWKLGPNVGVTPNNAAASNAHLVPNTWQLVKIHLDTSNNASGVFEAWIRPMGGSFRKVIEWIGGVTPNFTWSGFGAGGHSFFRMPTTIGWSNTTGGCWYYMDDFAMASSEANLPTYG